MNSTGSSLSDIIESFMPYIEKKAYALNLPGIDINDLKQEAKIALISAIDSYDENKGAVFSTYVITCINNRLTDLVRNSASARNRMLNESLSLSGEDDQIANAVVDSPEDTAILKDEYLRLLERIRSELSELERDSLLMFTSGYSYQEIADMKGTTPKAIGNALQRARTKLKKD